jgi:hypothetical protein
VHCWPPALQHFLRYQDRKAGFHPLTARRGTNACKDGGNHHYVTQSNARFRRPRPVPLDAAKTRYKLHTAATASERLNALNAWNRS